MLGNDIVDIDFYELPMQQHVRHLDRVCTTEEKDFVRRSVDPARSLALLWASKEAAYKLFAKQFASCSFIPRQFVTQIVNSCPAYIDQRLFVLYRGMHAEVSIISEQRWVHAVAMFPGMNAHSTVREIETCLFPGRKASDESQAVRFLAKSLLNELGLRDVTLQFEGRIPKLRLTDGSCSGMHVSLSHHGAFAAAVIAWPAARSLSPSTQHFRFVRSQNSEAVCSTCTA